MVFRSEGDSQRKSEYATYERLTRHNRVLSLLNSHHVDGGIQGRNIYQTFNAMVRYGDLYKGLQKVVNKGSECAGRLVTVHSGKTWMDVPLADAFCQVSSLL
jgi:hypothetical protein